MKEEIWMAIYIFTSGSLFSFFSWLNARTRAEDYRDGGTTGRIKIQGFTHSAIGGLISVTTFAGISHYHPDFSLLFKALIGISIGAFASESIIKLLERKINNVK